MLKPLPLTPLPINLFYYLQHALLFLSLTVSKDLLSLYYVLVQDTHL